MADLLKINQQKVKKKKNRTIIKIYIHSLNKKSSTVLAVIR